MKSKLKFAVRPEALDRLQQAVSDRYSGDTVTVFAVVDYSDRPTNAQLKAAYLKAGTVFGRRVRVVTVPVQQFNTPQASTLVAQWAFPADSVDTGDGHTVMANVAKIDATVNGVRQDDLLVAVLKNNTIVVGYSARDKVFGTILPYCDVIFRVTVPKRDNGKLGLPGAQHRHFRSRDILPRLQLGLLTGNAAWLGTLKESFTPEQAAKELGIRQSDKWNGWFIDRPYGNLKTDILETDRRLRGFRFGERVLVKIGHVEHEAVFARSLGKVPRGCLGVVRGSSSIKLPKKQVKLIDIMFRGGSAHKVMHEPELGLPILISKSNSRKRRKERRKVTMSRIT